MIDYIDRAADWLEAAGHPVSKRPLDAYTGKEGVVLLSLPQRNTYCYMDGTERCDLIVHVVVRRRGEYEAMSECHELAQLLTGAVLESANGSYRADQGGARIESHPARVPLDEDQVSTWEALVAVPVTKEQ